MGKKAIMTVAVLVAAMAMLSACQKKEEMGPAQKAGAAIDNAGDKVAKDIHDKLDKAKEAGQKVEDAARQAGDNLKEATGEVGKKVEQAGEKIQDAAKK